ncbi:MAG: hypothetical protein ABJP45_11465 [Cyclobacteriaceae bacterium]
MKTTGKILMMVAGGILLMHSFLPHSHHDELSDTEHVEVHEEAESILDFFRLAFHVNQGENHLEDFKNSQQYQAQFLVVTSIIDLAFGPVLIEEIPKSNSTTYLSNFQTRFKHKDLSFRGPPA